MNINLTCCKRFCCKYSHVYSHQTSSKSVNIWRTYC